MWVSPVEEEFAAERTPGRPLRVLHLTLGADAGGLSRYLIDVAEATRAAGHVVAAAGDDGAWRSAFQDADFAYKQIPLKAGLLGFRRSVRKMRRWLDAGTGGWGAADVIHTHYRRATMLARRLRRPDGRCPPILYTLHLSHLNVGGWRRWLTDFGDHTHAASADAVDWLVADARLPRERITLIPHGVDPLRFPRRDDGQKRAARAALGLPPDAVVAAHVGRLDDPKNEGWCLDALLHPSAPRDAHLIFAGEGPHEASLRARSGATGLAGRVHLLGHADPLPVYRAADWLLLPSGREGFSLACAEAMSVGVPHVRTHTSGATELTVEGETGFATPIDRAAFAATAADAMALPASRVETMGERGANLVRDRFTFARQMRQTLALYRHLAG